jgi:bacterial/archaeal transporter family protein
MHYLVYAVAAMLMWGIWGFLPKLAAARLDFRSASVWATIGNLSIVIPILLSLRAKPSTGEGAYSWSIASGLCGAIGGLFYYKALTMAGPNASSVITISALYPVVSVILACTFSREQLSTTQMIGIALCVAGGLLISTSQLPKTV